MYNPSIKSQPSSSSTSVTQLPQVLVQVQDVLVQIAKFIKQHGNKWNRAKATDLQHRIDNELFCLTTDRRTSKLNSLQKLKLLSILCNFYNGVVSENSSQKYLYFDLIFCGREGEALLHEARISFLVKLCSMALQFPSYSLFDDVAQWLMRIGKSESGKAYAQKIIGEIVENFIMVPEQHKMYEYLIPLYKVAPEFATLFIVFSIDSKTMDVPLITLLGIWFNESISSFLKIFNENPHLAKHFASESFDLLVRYDATNLQRDENHHRFHFAVLSLIMEWKTTAGMNLSCNSLIDILADSAQLDQQSHERLVEDIEFALHYDQFPIKTFKSRIEDFESCDLLTEQMLTLLENDNYKILLFSTLCDEPNHQVLQYADALFQSQLISSGLYITTIVKFDRFEQQIVELQQIVENCKRSFPNVEESDFLTNIVQELISPPKFPLEDPSFIGVKEFRPAILTLGSIFASFRVLKSDEEMADSFLMVGETFGMSRTEIVVDIFRSGFLIQLETVERDREALVDMFVYLKIPQILLKLIEQGVSKQEIYTALEKISNCTTLLNELDLKKCDNTLQCILDKLKSADVINEMEYENLVHNRNLYIKQKPELDSLISKSGSAGGQALSRYQLISVSLKAKQTFAKSLAQDIKKWIPLLVHLMKSGEVTVDAICSVFCADGDLAAFSSKLASINSLTEKPFAPSSDPEEIKNRPMMFDCSFILLSRIKYVYMDMRLDDMVADSTTSAFYKWTEAYFKHIEDAIPMPVNIDLKRNFLSRDFISSLKQGQAFWDDTWDYGDLIDNVPVIGDILLEEYRRGQNNERDIKNILTSFQEMTCLLLCLIQWLETQRDDIHRQELAKAIESVGKDQVIADQQLSKRWVYTMLVAKKCLKQMVQGRRQKEPRYTWVLTYARRQLPTLRQMEVPDSQMLKETYLYSNQQSWASPDVIAHIDRCNKSSNHRTWCECWMMQMLKSNTVDELLAASELCLAAALTSPVTCLIEFARCLVDYVLGNDYMASINQNYATVLAKMLVRIIILVIWAEDRRKQNQRLKTQRRMSRKRRHPEDAPLSVEDPASVASASAADSLAEQSDLTDDARIRRTLVFVQMKRHTKLLSLFLTQAGLPSTIINGDMSQDLRERALKEFREYRCPVLVATDVCARGIDIKDLDHVINFDLPEDPATYVHRIGRTGRLKEGTATSFYDPQVDGRILKDLIQFVRDAGQEPPEWLVDLDQNLGFGQNQDLGVVGSNDFDSQAPKDENAEADDSGVAGDQPSGNTTAAALPEIQAANDDWD
uniref:Mediator of RNA polymerase II transcription subunit 24 n=2 Tax=Acrobeloides nanus TaxID=290746 RepID=A0A914D3R8_9BILA